MAHSVQLAELLDAQRKLSSLPDVIIVCGEKDFPAHKSILSAANNYFRAMFTSGWDENAKGKIQLPTVKPEEMEIILLFLYTGNIKNVVNPSLLKTLLKTSDMFEINELFEYCYKEICKGLTSSYFLEIYDLADVYSNEDMTMYVVNFLAHHFTSISTSEEFLKLSSSQLQKIIQHPDICKTSKDDVVKGLLLWAEVEKKREEHLLDILIALDLKDISKEFLTHLLREHALVKKNLHILTLLTAEATSRLLIPTERDPRLFCFGGNHEKEVLRMYNIKENEWLQPINLTFILESGMSIVQFRDYIYFFGGLNVKNGYYSTKVIKYNPSVNKVTSVGQLKTAICDAGVGVLHDFIYVVNGIKSNGEYVHTVQRYCPAVGISHDVANTNDTHRSPGVLTQSGYLYVLGGFVDSVERYDPGSNEWTVITTIPGRLLSDTACILHEKLLVPTGSHGFHVYDFVGNSWAGLNIEGSPRVIYSIHTIRLDGKCIILACDEERIWHTYDPEGGQWLRKSEPNREPWNLFLTCVV